MNGRWQSVGSASGGSERMSRAKGSLHSAGVSAFGQQTGHGAVLLIAATALVYSSCKNRFPRTTRTPRHGSARRLLDKHLYTCPKPGRGAHRADASRLAVIVPTASPFAHQLELRL